MTRPGKFLYIQTGMDSRWAWGGTLKQTMESVIAEMPWHFATMASEMDAIYFPKPWPKSFPFPQIPLGIPAPGLVFEGRPEPQNLGKVFEEKSLQFQPFSWDEKTLEWVKKNTPKLLKVPSLGNAEEKEANLFPNVTIMRGLNGRRFSLELEKGLPGELAGWHVHSGSVVETIADIQNEMHKHGWREAMLKGEHGQAGNANVHVRENDDKSFQLAQGILSRCGMGVLEEWHSIECEYGYQYNLGSDGMIHSKRVHRMLTTGSGHFLGVLVEPFQSYPDAVTAAFEASSHIVSAALTGKGYWGSVGQDGYSYFLNGKRFFRPLSDLNVRMTMATPAHALWQSLQKIWQQPELRLAWLFLPRQYRLSKLTEKERQESLGSWCFNSNTKSGALWLTPGKDENGSPAERHSLLIVDVDPKRLEAAVQHFRHWSLTSS